MREEKIEILKNRILSLKDGWADNDENKAFAPSFINKIGKILQFISSWDLPDPTVCPCEFNSIDFFWRNKKNSVLINFKEEYGNIGFAGCIIEKGDNEIK